MSSPPSQKKEAAAGRPEHPLPARPSAPPHLGTNHCWECLAPPYVRCPAHIRFPSAPLVPAPASWTRLPHDRQRYLFAGHACGLFPPERLQPPPPPPPPPPAPRRPTPNAADAAPVSAPSSGIPGFVAIEIEQLLDELEEMAGQ